MNFNPYSVILCTLKQRGSLTRKELWSFVEPLKLYPSARIFKHKLDTLIITNRIKRESHYQYDEKKKMNLKNLFKYNFVDPDVLIQERTQHLQQKQQQQQQQQQNIDTNTEDGATEEEEQIDEITGSKIDRNVYRNVLNQDVMDRVAKSIEETLEKQRLETIKLEQEAKEKQKLDELLKMKHQSNKQSEKQKKEEQQKARIQQALEKSKKLYNK